MPSSRAILTAFFAAMSVGCFEDYEKVGDDATSAGSVGFAGSNQTSSTNGGLAGLGQTSSTNGGRSGSSSFGGIAGRTDSNHAGGAPATGCAAPNPACAAGNSDMESDSCGNCGKGKKTRTRQCRSDCTWDAWSSWSTCNNPEECVPGSKDGNTQTVSCPCGGSKTQQRTCADTCTWGAWTDASACDVSCCATLMYCDTPENIAAGRGTWCRRKTSACSRDQTMDDCMNILKQQGCALHETVYYDEG